MKVLEKFIEELREEFSKKNPAINKLKKSPVYHTTTFGNMRTLYENGITPTLCSNFNKVDIQKEAAYYFWRKPSYYPNDTLSTGIMLNYDDYPVVIEFTLENLTENYLAMYPFDTGSILSGFLASKTGDSDLKSIFSPSFESIEQYRLDISDLDFVFESLFDSDDQCYHQGQLSKRFARANRRLMQAYSKLLDPNYFSNIDDRSRTIELIYDSILDIKSIKTRLMVPRLGNHGDYDIYNDFKSTIEEIVDEAGGNVEIIDYYPTPQTNYKDLNQILKSELRKLNISTEVGVYGSYLPGEARVGFYDQNIATKDRSLKQSIVTVPFFIDSSESSDFKEKHIRLVSKKINKYTIIASPFDTINSFKINNNIILVSKNREYTNYLVDLKPIFFTNKSNLKRGINKNPKLWEMTTKFLYDNVDTDFQIDLKREKQLEIKYKHILQVFESTQTLVSSESLQSTGENNGFPQTPYEMVIEALSQGGTEIDLRKDTVVILDGSYVLPIDKVFNLSGNFEISVLEVIALRSKLKKKLK